MVDVIQQLRDKSISEKEAYRLESDLVLTYRQSRYEKGIVEDSKLN
jgi:hypothetical protein